MAHKKGVGSTDNGRDSNPKYLGVKIFGGQKVRAGNIIIRQRGTKFHAGTGTYLGRDFTLHAKVDGVVSFRKERKNRTFVYVTPEGELSTAPNSPATKQGETKEPTRTEKNVVSRAVESAKETAANVQESVSGAVQNVQETVSGTVENVQETVSGAVESAKEALGVSNTESDTAADKPAEVTLPNGKTFQRDDLKIVEGIGPKIEEILHEAGIKTWQELYETPAERVKEILTEAGPRYSMHEPKTWAKQAQMADSNKMQELQTYQDWLDGGKEPTE